MAHRAQQFKILLIASWFAMAAFKSASPAFALVAEGPEDSAENKEAVDGKETADSRETPDSKETADSKEKADSKEASETSDRTEVADKPNLADTTDTHDAPAVLQSPETELALAKTDLDNLTRRLNTAEELAGRLGLGPQTASAERSWKNSLIFYSHQEWTSAVRELNNYLNQTQVPELKTYLKSQFMLGRSYEELGYKEKALRAYFRYLATFLTAKEQDHDELIDVLRRMIPLASASTNASELRELLASLTSLDIPKDVQPALYFYAAKAAANTGETSLAQSWFARSSEAADPVLKAKALYMKALIALNHQDFTEAEELLAQVSQIDNEGSTRDLARLALARLSIHERKRETALKYYALVPEESTAFKEATFESVYVHLDLKQDAEARTKSVLYLSRWPDGAEALQLRMLLAYLDMRAGDLASAKKSIATTDARLHEINTWITQKLSNRTSISQTTLLDFTALTGGQLPLSPAVKDATQLFSRLAEAARRLADVRGNIRNILFTIGRANIEHLRPFWVNRAEQLALLGDDLLKVGHRLAAAEALLYDDRLTTLDRQKLQASLARRLRLLSPAAANHRQQANWAAFAHFADLTRKLATAEGRVAKAQAELATSRYLSTNSKVKPNESRQGRITELDDKTKHLTDSIAKALEFVRHQKVEDLLNTSPHRATGKFLSQYSASLADEALIISKVRDRSHNTVQKINAEDAVKAWAQWQFLATEIFRQLKDLDKEIGRGLDGLLQGLDGEDVRYRELQGRVTFITGELEGRLGQSISYLIDQYVNAINARFARNQKWQGDIDWLSYQSKLEEDHKLKEQIDLEQQILRDNLSDLQQGVLWQWPK